MAMQTGMGLSRIIILAGAGIYAHLPYRCRSLCPLFWVWLYWCCLQDTPVRSFLKTVNYLMWSVSFRYYYSYFSYLISFLGYLLGLYQFSSHIFTASSKQFGFHGGEFNLGSIRIRGWWICRGNYLVAEKIGIVLLVIFFSFFLKSAFSDLIDWISSSSSSSFFVCLECCFD